MIDCVWLPHGPFDFDWIIVQIKLRRGRCSEITRYRVPCNNSEQPNLRRNCSRHILQLALGKGYSNLLLLHVLKRRPVPSHGEDTSQE
ncbi:hypothetical protein pipiens_010257 [Culex pipiens pipiens]|uniref:Uncharacterized protein n=1 Tax=Culex pipiens pipiens TaxID=38569 RepID=A0ABD1DBY2_CULPP